MKEVHSMENLFKALEVSCSGYYDWRARQSCPCARKQVDQQLIPVIRNIYEASRHNYGSPRVHHQLKKKGFRHGRNRVARLMKEHGWEGVQRKRWRIQTTNSRHDQPIAPNLLAVEPLPVAPNKIWVSDITYVPTDEGWLYVAGIMDLYSRKLVGWAMSQTIDAELVLSALHMAVTHRKPLAGLLHHSDRGVQYACRDYRQALLLAGATPSMSRKANCYDNASMESFWSTLKTELIYRHRFESRAQARRLIFDFIETFYNRERLHSSLGYNSPLDFENQNN